MRRNKVKNFAEGDIVQMESNGKSAIWNVEDEVAGEDSQAKALRLVYTVYIFSCMCTYFIQRLISDIFGCLCSSGLKFFI